MRPRPIHHIREHDPASPHPDRQQQSLLPRLDRRLRRAAVRPHPARAFPAGLRRGPSRSMMPRSPRSRAIRPRRRFDNTIAALELSGRALDARRQRVSACSPAPTPTTRCWRSSARFRRARARHWNGILLNEPLFRRIDALYAQRRDTLGLTAEQARVLERYHLMFTRAGAALDARAKKRLAEINERLATLGTTFSQNVLADEQAYALVLESEAGSRRPAGLRAARPRAQPPRSAGMAGKHVITLSRSSVEPFLQFSAAARPAREGLPRLDRARRRRRQDRQQGDHRRDAWRCAPSARGCSATRPSRITGSTTPWRRRRQAVRGLLDRVWEPARARALAERDAMQALVARGGRQFRARAVGLALLRREAAQGAVRSRRGDDQALSPARAHHRGGVLHRPPAVRPVLRAPQGRAGLASRRARCGRCAAPTAAIAACSSATISRAPRSAAAPG